MKLLAITHSLGANGAAVCLADLLVELRSRGWEVDLLYRGSEALRPQIEAAGVRFLEDANLPDYEVAIVNTLIDSDWVMTVAKRLPVVFWVHEGRTMFSPEFRDAKLWNAALRASSRIVFQSHWQAHSVFGPLLEGVDLGHVAIVPPGVPEWIFALGDRRRAAGVNDAAGAAGGAAGVAGAAGAAKGIAPPPRIAWLGTVIPRKRPQDLVEAARKLSDLRVRCDFYGGLEYLHAVDPAVVRFIDAHPETYKLHGSVERHRVMETISQADVFCMPSGDETFAMGVLEAAALGLPLAISGLPSYAGVWFHGVNALISPVGASDLMAWNIRALLSDPPLAQRLVRAARETALRYTQREHLESMLQVLRDAIVDGRQAKAAR